MDEKKPADLEMFILDVMRHDEVENLSSIVNMLNDFDCIGWRDHWPHDFKKEEVLPAVQRLIEKKLIRPIVYDERE